MLLNFVLVLVYADCIDTQSEAVSHNSLMFLYSNGGDTQETMASAVAMIPTNVSRESVSVIHRLTKENRSLWYKLTVLQQPERARACGSGMKGEPCRPPFLFRSGNKRREKITQS